MPLTSSSIVVCNRSIRSSFCARPGYHALQEGPRILPPPYRSGSILSCGWGLFTTRSLAASNGKHAVLEIGRCLFLRCTDRPSRSSASPPVADQLLSHTSRSTVALHLREARPVKGCE